MAKSRKNHSKQTGKSQHGGGSCGLQSPQTVMTGGTAEFNGAAPYAEAVYGGPGQQMAGVGNVIAANNVSGGNVMAAIPTPQSGGRRRKKKGGYGVTQVLVPAALFAANYLATSKGMDELVPKMMRDSRRRGSRRRRRGSRSRRRGSRSSRRR